MPQRHYCPAVLVRGGGKYPDLKADRAFRQLQARVSQLEDQIADRRELYNESVNLLNIRIEQFPDVLVAGMMRLGAPDLCGKSTRTTGKMWN
ncbi:MAG: LemA family protein [Desulfobacterales bacterium]